MAGDASGSSVSRETERRFDVFVDHLIAWNATINLVADADPNEIRQRHIGDSLRLLPLLPAAGSVVDLGSGAGFPGLILAMACDLPVVLIEADARKAAFLREAIRLTGASARVSLGRVEAWRAGPFDLIVARAFAPLPALLRLSSHLRHRATRYLLLKGETFAQEISAAKSSHTFESRIHPDRPPRAGCILELFDVADLRS